MGAATFTPLKSVTLPGGLRRATGLSGEAVVDNQRAVHGTLVLSSSYATGGDSLSLANVSLSEVRGLLVEGVDTGSRSGLTFELVGTPSAPLVRAYDSNTTQVSNGTNLSTRAPARVWLVGS